MYYQRSFLLRCVNNPQHFSLKWFTAKPTSLCLIKKLVVVWRFSLFRSLSSYYAEFRFKNMACVHKCLLFGGIVIQRFFHSSKVLIIQSFLPSSKVSLFRDFSPLQRYRFSGVSSFFKGTHYSEFSSLFDGTGIKKFFPSSKVPLLRGFFPLQRYRWYFPSSKY